MKKSYMPGILLFSFILATIITTIAIMSRDIPPHDTSSLEITRPHVEDVDNAFTYFIAATNIFYFEDYDLASDYLGGEKTDPKQIKELLTKNSRTFELIGQGLSCKTSQFPEIKSIDTLMPYIAIWRSIGRLMAAKARHERLAEEYVNSANTCISLLKFGDMIQANAESVINYLVGYAVLGLGITQAQDLSRDKKIPLEELKRLSESIEKLTPPDKGLIRAYKMEFKISATLVDDLKKGNYPLTELRDSPVAKLMTIFEKIKLSSYLFKRNETKKLFAERYCHIITNVPLFTTERNLDDIEETPELFETNKLKTYTQPNFFGRVLFYIMTSSTHRLMGKMDYIKARLTGTKLILAINIYERENGKLPADLNALVPEYFQAIPLDPYDGKPFRYSLEKEIVYSIGEDLKDDEGSSKTISKHSRKTKDMVFHIREIEASEDETTE